MANNTFPDDWRDEPCFIVAIPRPLVPYVGGLLKILEQRGFWATSGDFTRGYTATAELEACLMATCLNVLLDKQDALYRMLDTALYGKVYEVTSEDPLVVEPGIPDVHEVIYQVDFGLMSQVDRLTQLVDNRLAGTETPLYADIPGIKQQLEDIIAALAEGTDLSAVLTDLEAIALLLA
jgi:hypothetical protein